MGFPFLYLVMNFLAHAYLSFGEEEVLIGNFIGDFVKGSEMKKFPILVQAGISLHRHIDTYTDSHPLVKELQNHLRPQHRLYSRVISDMYFDYFLAKNWNKYSHIHLKDFSQHTYSLLAQANLPLPESFHRMLYWMKHQDWLYAYRTHDGLQAALDGLSRRARFDSKMEQASLLLQKKEEEFELIFFEFFKDLETFAQVTLTQLRIKDDCT